VHYNDINWQQPSTAKQKIVEGVGIRAPQSDYPNSMFALSKLEENSK